MEVDRRKFLASLGAGALAVMTPEDRAEALEHHMIDLLDDEEVSHHHHQDGAPSTADLDPRLLDKNELLAEAAQAEAKLHAKDHKDEQEQERPQTRRGTGNLFRTTEPVLDPMPKKPTLEDFFGSVSLLQITCYKAPCTRWRMGNPKRTFWGVSFTMLSRILSRSIMDGGAVSSSSPMCQNT